jgi:hypothetical protein
MCRRGLSVALVLSFGLGGLAEEPRAVIERAVKAMGGEEALATKAATAVKLRGQLLQTGRGVQGIELNGAIFTQSEQVCRLEVHIEAAGRRIDVTQVIADGKGWRRMADGTISDMSDEEIKTTQDAMNQDRARALLPLLQDKGYTLTMLENAEVEGRPAIGVKAAYKDRADSLLYFDETTGLLIKAAYRNKDGKLVESIISDYRRPGRQDEERVLRAAGLETDPHSLLAFLRRQAPDPAKVARVRALVRKLGDDSFDVREQAATELVALEKVAVPFLQRAQNDGDAEVARRAGECLEQIEKRANDETLGAAVRLVGWTKPEGGAEVLLALLPAADASLAPYVQAVLVVYAERDGKPDPALVKALDDADPVRQAAARAVLGKDGGDYLKQPGRPLFVRGPRLGTRTKYIEDGKPQFEVEVVEFRLVNSLDPKLFEKPGNDN